MLLRLEHAVLVLVRLVLVRVRLVHTVLVLVIVHTVLVLVFVLVRLVHTATVCIVHKRVPPRAILSGPFLDSSGISNFTFNTSEHL